MSQQIRPSQLVTTYGPGAIIETTDGPGIMPSLARMGLYNSRGPDEFEIRATRLEGLLGPGTGVVRIPSNAEMRAPEDRVVGTLFSFPRWALCTQHSIIYPVDDRCTGCRVPRGRTQAIRFVMACPKGHLDDVRWPSLMKHRTEHAPVRHLRWRGTGALRNITIECPACGAGRGLGDAYNRPGPCSGRFPELDAERPGCPAQAQMIQRGAANLRMAELVSAVTIPPRDSELHLLLRRSVVDLAIRASGARTRSELVSALNRLGDRVPHDAIAALSEYDDDRVEEAIAGVLVDQAPTDEPTLMAEELGALRDGAIRGAPPQAGPDGRGERQFQMPASSHAEFETAIGRFRVAAASRLRVVIAQRGYRRTDPAAPDMVPTSSEFGGRVWYPGVEVFGEGIFLMLIGPPALPDPMLQRARQLPDFTVEHLWWHTLSHRLLRVIGRDAGYSTASIRERVYAPVGLVDGGLLLYTAQPGGDGTLGGLAALTGAFGSVIDRAVSDLGQCSNDPLCSARAIGRSEVNGAACYACSFVSETSCDHRNTGLDRLVLARSMVVSDATPN
jgi:hypothetical protein